MIAFRLLQEEDLGTRVEWLNTVSLVSNMSIFDEITLEGTNAWFSRVRNTPHRFDFTLIDDLSPVAMGGLTNYVEESGAYESYIFVNPLAQSKGYGSLMLYKMAMFAFSETDCKSIFAYVMPSNTASLKIHKKIGFEEVDNSGGQLFPLVKENRLVLRLTRDAFHPNELSEITDNQLRVK